MFPGQLGKNEEGTCAESAWSTEHPALLVAFLPVQWLMAYF